MQVQKTCMQVRLETIMQVQKTISIPFGLRSFLPFSFPTFLPPSVPLFFHSFSPSFNSFAFLPSLYSFFLSLRPTFHFSSTIYLLSFLPPPLCRCTPHLLPFFSCLMPSLLTPSFLNLFLPFTLFSFYIYSFLPLSVSSSIISSFAPPSLHSTLTFLFLSILSFFYPLIPSSVPSVIIMLLPSLICPSLFSQSYLHKCFLNLHKCFQSY